MYARRLKVSCVQKLNVWFILISKTGLNSVSGAINKGTTFVLLYINKLTRLNMKQNFSSFIHQRPDLSDHVIRELTEMVKT